MKRRKNKIKRRPRRSGPRPTKPVVKRARQRSHTAAGGGGRRHDPNAHMKLVVKPIGIAKTLIFRHRDGRTYSHQFKQAKLYVTAGGRELIIAKVSVDRSTLQIRG